MVKAEASVQELVDAIGRGELRLPEMQRRYVWCSCHHNRVVEFGKWILEEVTACAPPHLIIFSIIKMLLRCYLYDLILEGNMRKIYNF
ncbi:MAG: hypothetical protein KKH04_15760 [Proteobacteria bacterium]|nr:hypothetical protein [Pseudomonadota bacterium]